MSDLTDFLLARIAEDEAVARAMVEDNDGDDTGLEGMFDDLTTPGTVPWLRGALSDEFAAMMARYVAPARVLRECQAKRTIIERHPLVPAVDVGIINTGGLGCQECHVLSKAKPDAIVEALGPCDTLTALAAVYDNHPDYDPSWVV